MNTVNPAALLRSLIVYAVCVPLAITAGYLLTDPMDYGSLGFMGVLAAVLIFPLLMKWHYPLLIFSWSAPVILFFVPSHPPLFIFMVAMSLGISILERILDRNQPFLPAGSIRWPLFALLAVVIFTAELTGGIGLMVLGGGTYGGRKYVLLILGIASFFAIIARPIPKKQANWYLLLYFAGGFLNFLPDSYSFIPGLRSLLGHFIAPSNSGMDESGHVTVELGTTRLGSTAAAAGGVVLWMMARYGLRGVLTGAKLWRPIVLGLMFLLMLLGGFRTMVIGPLLLLGLLFYMERIYRTGAMVAVVMAGVLGGALLVPLASHLPHTFQRSLSFLPLDIDPMVRADAEGSTEWRLTMWQALLPEIPKYLLLGKGYSFSAQTYDETMGANATFKNSIDAGGQALAVSSDFHSGPLAIIIPFGIWGVLAWLWFWAAGWHVLWRNYRYGDPALIHINRYLFAWFMVGIFNFLFVFGDPVAGVAGFGGLIGFSIAMNHGVMGPRSFPREKPAALPGPAAGRPAFAPRPAYPAMLGR